MRRVDERRHEHGGRTFPAEIVQPRRTHFDRDPALASWRRAFGTFVFREAIEGRPRQFGVFLANASYQFEKQWKRPRRVFMLRCTLVR